MHRLLSVSFRSSIPQQTSLVMVSSSRITSMQFMVCWVSFFAKSSEVWKRQVPMGYNRTKSANLRRVSNATWNIQKYVSTQRQRDETCRIWQPPQGFTNISGGLGVKALNKHQGWFGRTVNDKLVQATIKMPSFLLSLAPSKTLMTVP